MQLSDAELSEFKNEALDLIDGAEKCLLALDAGGDFKKQYDSIFRAFHNLKGSAGMLEMTRLQSFMHQVETILTQQKDNGSLSQDLIEYFLASCDQIRKILDNHEVADLPIPGTPPAAITSVPTESPITIETKEAAPKILTASLAPETPDALTFILHYYSDLDNYFLLQGNEKERKTIQEKLMKLLTPPAGRESA